MSQIVKLRRSSTGGNRPTNSQLQLGELAINTTDGKLYFSKSGSLNTSVEEVLTTNAQNTGSLNLSGSFNLIGTESITGSTNINGSLNVTGNTSLTSLIVSGSDPVANLSAYLPSSSVYNNAGFNAPDRVAAGVKFGWNNESWTIGAARGLTTDVDGLVFSRNGERNLLLHESGDMYLTGALRVTGSLYLNGEIVGTGKLNETAFNTYTSSVSSTFAGTSSYALTASYVDNPTIVSGSTKKTTVTSASTTWSLNHQMNERYPSITVFDSDGYVVIPTGVRAIDSNNIEVYFSIAQTGTVIATLGGSGAVGATGDSGSSGTSGADGIGGYTQTYTSSTTWSVAHNLDLDYPGITVWDSNRKVIIPSEITSVDSNNLQITFPIAQAGEVHIVRGGHMVSGSQDLSAVGTITPSADGLYNLGSTSKQFNNVYISGSLLVNGVPYSSGAVDTGSFAITGSNTFKGDQTFSGSLIPVGSGSYDLGTPSNPFRHLYLSSASLYIDGQKVLGSTNQELQITTDNGQSIKILESGTDTITFQTVDGDIQLKSSGGGNVLLDPTSGSIDIRGNIQVQDGFKILSSGGNSVVFGDDIIVSGSANFTNGITINGTSYTAATSGTSGTSGSNGSSGTSGSNGSSGTAGTSGSSGISNSFFNYQADTQTISGNPGNGHIIWNNAIQTGSTQINISDIDQQGNNLDVFLSQLKSGSRITLQDKSIQGNYQVWDIGTPTDNTTYWSFPVTLVSATHQISNNDEILFIITTTPSGTSGSSGSNGSSGTSGSSGSNGSSGTSGSSGSNGSSGTSGSSGSNGSSGSSGTTTITNATDNRVMTSAGGVTLNAEANLTFDGSTLAVTGAVTTTGNLTVGGTLTENSSLRYKENVETIKYGLDKVLQMRGVTYDKKDNGVKEIGLIAEELNKIAPELVNKNEEGEPDSVSYGRITAVLIEALKEQQKQIEELKALIK